MLLITKILVLLFGYSLISKILALSINGYSIFKLQSFNAILWGVHLDLVLPCILSTIIYFITLSTTRTKNNIINLPKIITFLSTIYIIITTFGDAIYSLESGTHVTFEIFTSAGSELELLSTAIVKYYWVLITMLGLIISSIWFIKRISFTKPSNYQFRILPISLGLISWILFTVTIVRGGWSDAPQSPLSAYKIGNKEQAFIAWSAPYSITYHLLKGVDKAAQQITPSLSPTELNQAAASQQSITPNKKANVIMVLLESWPAIDSLSYAHQADAMPFFDQLRQQSLSTTAMYADAVRTVQGIFSTQCSYPNPIGSSIAGTQLQNKNYQCLPEYLHNAGWSTTFIQGSGKGIVGNFAQSLGFKYSFGKTDYPFKAETNYWGYMDDGIYKFSLNKIDQMIKADPQQPFYVAINTGTTHDTYLPETIPYKFGKQSHINTRRSIISAADSQLKYFIEHLPKNSPYPTLVILVADHTASVNANGIAQHSIPFLMFATDDSLPKKIIPAHASQRDIAPTIIDWLGGSLPWQTGQSLLDNQYNGLANYSTGEIATIIKDNYLIEFNARNKKLIKCAEIQNDTVTLKNQSCQQPMFQKLWQQSIKFTNTTQDLLFKGKTDRYKNNQ